MKRLVYSPRTEAFVKTDFGIYDLSPYITNGSITRGLDQVSTATLTLRNPKLHFTEHKGEGPLLHPMDPIVVTLTRIRNRPIQVFTGFLDTTPYLQLFPGTITLNASCTLKKLQYTYVDPGLTFFNDWLVEHGWETQEGFGATNVAPSTPLKDGKLQDSGFGKLLFAFLTEIGGWDEGDVFIEALPTSIVQVVSDLFAEGVAAGEEAQRELDALLQRIIGTTGLSHGTGLPQGDTSGSATGGTTPANMTTGKFLGQFTATSYGPPWNAINGTGITSDGTNLQDGKPIYGIATDPGVIKTGKYVMIWPNPFDYKGAFKAFDVGGAIDGNHVDIYDWRGRSEQLGWGSRDVKVWEAK